MAKSNIALDRAKFTEALGSIARTGAMGAELERQPGTALSALGFELPESTIDELNRTPLSARVQATLTEPTTIRAAETYVHVGVSVAVSVAVDTVLAAQRAIPAEEITRLIDDIAASGVELK